MNIRKLLACGLCAAMAACGGGNAPSGEAVALDAPAATPPRAQAQQADTAAATAALRVFQAHKGRPPTAAEYAGIRASSSESLSVSLATESLALTDAQMTAKVLTNMGVTSTTVNANSLSILSSALTQYFGIYGPGQRGVIVNNLVGLLAGLERDATWGAAAGGFNTTVESQRKQLEICTTCEAAGAAVNPGSSTTGSFSATTQAVRHATRLTGGNAYYLTFTSSLTQFAVDIRDAGNNLVAPLAVGVSARIPFTPPTDGNYSLVAKSGGAPSGAYSIEVANVPIRNAYGEDMQAGGGGDDGSAGSGAAGDGKPIANASVRVVDSTGRTSFSTTNANGYFEVDLTNMVAPLIVSVTRPDGFVWRAISTAPVLKRKNQVLNLTGLTDKITSDLATSAGLAGGSASINTQVIAANQSRIASIKTSLNNGLVSKLVANGLDPRTFDPITSAFRAITTDPHDRLLEAVKPVRETTAGATSIVFTLAGGGDPAPIGQNGVSGYVNATGINARFYHPIATVDSNGVVYVADQSNHAVRRVSREGVVTTLAGGGPNAPGFVDGTGTAARFNQPHGAVVDAAGNVYVTDVENEAVRKITPAGVVTTIAGGTRGFADGTGRAARFMYISAIAMDNAGNLIVVDGNNNRIRKVTTAGVVTTIAGSGAKATVDGVGTNASFDFPQGVAVDKSGFIWVAEYGSSALRKISPSGVVTTVIGPRLGNQDGPASQAGLYAPTGVAVGPTGDVFIADFGNQRVRKLDVRTLIVSTVAGTGDYGFTDGAGTKVTFAYPVSVALDAAGRIYVGDHHNHAIRVIIPAGFVANGADGTAGDGMVRKGP